MTKYKGLAALVAILAALPRYNNKTRRLASGTMCTPGGFGRQPGRQELDFKQSFGEHTSNRG